jgi:hypothetical protein
VDRKERIKEPPSHLTCSGNFAENNLQQDTKEERKTRGAREYLETDFNKYLKLDVCYKPIVKVLQIFWFVSFNSNKKRGGGFL